MPSLVKGQSAKVALVRTRVVLAGAIDSLGDTRECQVDQRERFARGQFDDERRRRQSRRAANSGRIS